jgi:DNA-binding FrmR family transcriptional regulator
VQPLKPSGRLPAAAAAGACGGGAAAGRVTDGPNIGENAIPNCNPVDTAPMTVLNNAQARTDVLNRLRRAEGQIRGIQRMVEEGEDCLKIGQQFSAVRKALDSTYLRMTVCFMEQELNARVQPDEAQKAGLDAMVKDMETMLARMG